MVKRLAVEVEDHPPSGSGWTQVKTGLNPVTFTLHTWPTLLKTPDPWKDFRASAIGLRPARKAMKVD